ncbi:hypothetical protein [Paraglaciecola sp. L1A13]|uniref:hypothetical protein n=1 Tax=Paraglaciecola sp. L1A13 TaxID=2686359 RepID=UPI00131C1FAF|nr:hypothetical protein [Paraglaciecola sp. L1A13]
MCSSPKGGRGNRPRSAPSKSFSEGFTTQQRARFTDVANRAQERREQRLATNKRWQKSQHNDINNNVESIEHHSPKAGMFSWFSEIFSAHS